MSEISGIKMTASDNSSITVRDVTVSVNSSTINKPRKPYENEDFNVPLLEESLFVGRDNILEQLSNLFFKQNKRKVALYGLPGYGKTETAKHFIKKCKCGKINHILWMNASTQEDLKESFGNIAEKLNFEKCNEIREVFESFDAEKTIIVFDNAPDRQTILEYETAAVNFFCLITSHVRYWNRIEALEIKELSLQYALEILNDKIQFNNYYNSENSNSLIELADILGRVPLPLQIIGSYIEYEINMKDGCFDIQDYITRLKYSQDEFIDKSVTNCEACILSTIPYSKSLYEAMKICFDKISKNVFASNLLYVCSFLNPEHIYYNTTLSEMVLLEKENKDTLSNAATYLKLFSLVEVDFKTTKISMHRFVQTIIRYHLTKCDVHFQNEIYGACLKLTLTKDHCYHIPSIIMCADTSANYINTFFNFYSDNLETYKTNEEYGKLKSWEAKCTGLQLILEILIEGRCKKSLEKALVHLDPKTRYYINEFNLLNVATMSDDAEIFELLLTFNPSVNKTDIDGHCALHAATFKWNEKIIDLLLKNDANTTLKDNNNNTLLHTFIRGAYYFTEPSVDVTQAKRILNKIKSTLQIKEIKNGSGESLLHVAAAAVRPELVHLLICDFEIDANIQDPLGYTPLHNLIYIASNHKVDEQRIVRTAKVLLDNNARIDIQNCHGTAPLEYATRLKVDCLKELFDNFSAEAKESWPKKRRLQLI